MSQSLTSAYFEPPSRDRLIERGLPLVRRIAYRMARRLPPNVDVGDLIGAGTEGLVKAAESYDSKVQPRFESYAEARIRGAILDELRKSDQMTRHGRRKMAEVTKIIRTLRQELGREPDEQEVATRLGLDLDAYHKLSENLARGPALGRLGEADPDELASGFTEPDVALETRQLRQQLAEAIRKLPERNQQVLALYYQEDCTQSEIGAILGVSESRVCQILGESAARLRASLGGAIKKPRTSRRKKAA